MKKPSAAELIHGVIEFVRKKDSTVHKMLALRADTLDDGRCERFSSFSSATASANC
jgi:hypothetical protein